MQYLRYTVPAARSGQSVRAVLKGELRLSNALYKSLKWRENAILLNGRPVNVGDAVSAGDTLSVALTERRAPSALIAACSLSLDVVFEDEYLLVLNKPPHIPMHSKSVPSMAGALRAYLGGDTAAHFVSRLDRGVSGLCLAAKSGYVHDRFRAALHTEALYREYRAFAEGVVTPPAGVIDLPVGPA